MNKIFTVIMYLLWSLSLIGILIITFTNFQYVDLNTIVLVLFAITLLNTFFEIKKRR